VERCLDELGFKELKLISCYVIDAENDVFAGISRPKCKVNVIVSVEGKYLERAVFLL
jgi:hypothetical protein